MAMTTTKRKKMENLIYAVFDALDPSGSNTKKYKDAFTDMSDVQFDKYFKTIFNNDNLYLILDNVEYTKQNLTLDTVIEAAKVLDVPLFERVVFPHMSPDPSKPIVTPAPCPVGYIHIKRLQQMISKKNSTSIDMSERSTTTGQATGKSKNGRCSDLETGLVLQYGLDNVLKELYSCRSDDLKMKEQMMQLIQEKGYFSLDELDSDVANKTALNTIDVYFTGMQLNTDLVTKGLMNIKTLNEES